MPPARKNPGKRSLAGTAGDQVRAIIEAAETTAAQIRTAAEEDAERIRDEARAEAKALLEELRGGVERLAAELGVSQEARPAVSAVSSPRELEVPAAPRELETPAAAEGDREPEVQLAEDAAAVVDEADDQLTQPPPPVESAPAPAPAPAADSEPAPSTAADADLDLEGARLVALNMALDGTPRKEVDRYLRQNFDLVDQAALLDDVFASVGR